MGQFRSFDELAEYADMFVEVAFAGLQNLKFFGKFSTS
jgi:hypothetical protein